MSLGLDKIASAEEHLILNTRVWLGRSCAVSDDTVPGLADPIHPNKAVDSDDLKSLTRRLSSVTAQKVRCGLVLFPVDQLIIVSV